MTINITAVNQAPFVTLTSPANGQIFAQGQSITLAASPLDPEGQIASVQFLDGATVLTTLNAAPWQFVAILKIGARVRESLSGRTSSIPSTETGLSAR